MHPLVLRKSDLRVWQSHVTSATWQPRYCPTCKRAQVPPLANEPQVAEVGAQMQWANESPYGVHLFCLAILPQESVFIYFN
ncbi:Protein of unknown function [Gryllus bimaculatus]|nr:Protein of unknown function [Gryllus bimaculatus]